MKSSKLSSMLMLLACLGLGAAVVGGCNTVSGAGQDIEAAGEEITEEAEENKGY